MTNWSNYRFKVPLLTWLLSLHFICYWFFLFPSLQSTYPSYESLFSKSFPSLFFYFLSYDLASFCQRKRKPRGGTPFNFPSCTLISFHFVLVGEGINFCHRESPFQVLSCLFCNHATLHFFSCSLSPSLCLLTINMFKFSILSMYNT